MKLLRRRESALAAEYSSFRSDYRASDRSGPGGSTMARVDDLIAAKNTLSASLLRARARGGAVSMIAAHTVAAARKNAGRNVHAVGVGRKIVKGKWTATMCVRLYVVEKIAESVIPLAARLPKRIAGLPTDVIASPPARIHQAIQAATCTKDRRTRRRPVVGGISAAHGLVSKTTLGCFCHSVRAGEADRLYMLSCNHAFANLDRGSPGDAILQPSTGDRGVVADLVGRLARSVPIRLDGKPNSVDAAIAQIAPAVKYRNEICTVGPLAGIVSATEGMIVCKHGRTTGYTEGKVTDVSMDPFFEDYAGQGSALFVDQLRIEPTVGYNAPPGEAEYQGWFAAPGDSGSVIVEKSSRRAVGLHFGGMFGISVANPIAEVCRQLEITIP